MSLTMEKGLIVREYQQSRDKNAQIAILADLNGCSVDEIMNVLIEAGAIYGIPGAKKKKVESVKWTKELDAEVSKLAREGLKLNEIAERLGMNKQCIYDRRQVLKKQAERLAVDLGAKEKKKRVLPQSRKLDSSLPEGASKKQESPPKNKDELMTQKNCLCDTDTTTTPKTARGLRAEALGYGVMREIIEMLKSAGLEVTVCSIDVLERSFCIKGIEEGALNES